MVRGFLLPRGDLEKVDFNYLIEMLKKILLQRSQRDK